MEGRMEGEMRRKREREDLQRLLNKSQSSALAGDATTQFADGNEKREEEGRAKDRRATHDSDVSCGRRQREKEDDEDDDDEERERESG